MAGNKNGQEAKRFYKCQPADASPVRTEAGVALWTVERLTLVELGYILGTIFVRVRSRLLP